jgi:DNA polymerase-3 subunit gamma/tau
MAKAINCTNPQNGNPCNACPSCRGIDSGGILDVLELDAASNNGVDNVRALREEAVFTPVDVKKRVYIIDEVHMLSGAAFNALLKILEEPPEHLVFILATTEIHKVPMTILSRCQRFTFKRILPEKITERLLYVAGREGQGLTEDAAALLSRLADGSLRDALSLLDQCAWGETVDVGRVLSAIGLAGNSEILDMLTAVAQGDAAGALHLLDRLYDAGKVMASVLEELTDLVRDILVVSLLPGGGLKLLTGGFELPVLEDFKKKFADAELMEILNILRATLSDLTKSSGGRLLVELCLMRLCLLRMSGGERPDVRQRTSASKDKQNLSESLNINKAKDREVAAEKAPPPLANPVSLPVPENEASFEEKPVYDETPASIPAAEPEPAAVRHAANDVLAEAPSASSTDVWSEILRRLKPKLDGPSRAALNESPVLIDGKKLTIRTKDVFARNAVNDPFIKDAIQAAASAVMDMPVEVRVVVDDGGSTANGGDAGAASTKLDDTLKRFPSIFVEE